MRCPNDDDFNDAGALKRLWYAIICPFTHGSRLWIVTTSILCTLAVVQSANGSWGYHGSAQDTGFLSSNYINGVRLAWEIDAADAGLDRIDDYVARDGRLFIVGYKGTQRVAVGYDASYSTPRQLWRVDVDDEEGISWWDGDLLVGNTLISPADGTTTTGWPSPGIRVADSPYEHPSMRGRSTGAIGPVRLYCTSPATVPCQAWDKNATHVWDFDASTGSFPESVTPVDGWVPLRTWMDEHAGPAMGESLGDLTGFLNVNTGERVGLEALNEACASFGYMISGNCRVVESYTLQERLIRASDGWVIGGESGYFVSDSNSELVASMGPDGSNPQIMVMTKPSSDRLANLRTLPATENDTAPTIEDFLHYAATGEASWESSLAVEPWIDMVTLVVNDETSVPTGQRFSINGLESPSAMLSTATVSKDSSLIFVPYVELDSPPGSSDVWGPALVNVGAAIDAASRPSTRLSDKLLGASTVHGWRSYGLLSASPVFDDLIVGLASPSSSWFEHLAALSPAPGERIVGLTPVPDPMRSMR